MACDGNFLANSFLDLREIFVLRDFLYVVENRVNGVCRYKKKIYKRKAYMCVVKIFICTICAQKQ